MSSASPNSSERHDAILIVQKFIDQHPPFQLTYSCIEGGEAHEKTYQFRYKMGEEVLAQGTPLSKKKKAKRCAAQRTEDVLRCRGYKLW
jgi:dsRNA-specific ribonuclease